ncbi:MAG: Serine-tRNA ligase [Candidatus Levybacteria bacterium GW2011_GWA2_40_8]|nr:MAG: Serine-tRNA ligase [Candidatus Levybacteria bacterium GW2011_GWA2_40_8]
MLDIQFIRENPSLVQKSSINKGININIDHVLEIDRKYRELQAKVQEIRAKRNTVAKEQNIEEGKKLKVQLEKEENALNAVGEELKEWLLKIPNLSKDDVKVGKDESDNEVVRKEGSPRKFVFTPKDHLALGKSLEVIDVERAAKISGSRFYFLKNEVVLLSFALKQLAFETLIREGFIPVLPPVLINLEIMRGLGYMEGGGDEDMYVFEKDGLVLVGTSEQSLVAMHKDETFNLSDLPKRYVGFSTCFRREAGSYGKDTRGIIRAHQFDKVEMVSFIEKGQDDKEQEYLLSLEEKLLGLLNIPYQVVKVCSGELGYPAARKYDLEAWIPSEGKYREVTSVSTTTDFQSRRLNIKYQDKGKTEFVDILNGTAFSTRPIVSILENYQNEDGSVSIPKALQKYLNFERISPKK